MKHRARMALGLGIAALACALVVVLARREAGGERAARPGADIAESGGAAGPGSDVEPDPVADHAGRAMALETATEAREVPPPAETPDAGALLEVTVLDPAGRPVGGARVLVIGGWSADSGSRELDRTDTNGKTRMRPPRERSLLHADAPGFEGAHASTETPVLRLGPVATLRGRVLDQGNGAPIPGARIRLERTDLCEFCAGSEATAGVQGRFALEGVPLAGSKFLRGAYARSSRILVSAEGYLPRQVEFELREEESELTVELRPGLSLELELVDAESRQPIEGAIVRSDRAEERTGADGRVRSTSLLTTGDDDPAGLTASAPGYVDLGFVVHSRAAEPGRLVEVPLLRSVTLAAELVDPDGKPVEAKLHVRPEAGARERFSPEVELPAGWAYRIPRMPLVPSDGEGRARIVGLLPGTPHQLSVHAGQLTSTTTTLVIDPAEPGAVIERRIVVRPDEASRDHGRLRVRVHSGERPLQAYVRWSGPSSKGGALTDLDGRLLLEGVEVGEVHLDVAGRPGFMEPERWLVCMEQVRWERTVEVRLDEESEVDLDVGLPMVRLAGRVELADGRPAPGRLVRLEAEGMCLLDRAITDSEGGFELWTRADLAPQEAVVRHGSTEHRAAGIDPNGEPPVIVLPELGELRWRALDAGTGEVLRELEASHRPTGAAAGEFRLVRTAADPEGWHRIELTPGSYDLRLTTADGTYLPLLLEGVSTAVAEPLTVELERGLELEITLAEGLEPWPDEEVNVSLLDEELLPLWGEDPERIEALTGRNLTQVTLWFFSDSVHLRGLRPGHHTFLAFPDTLVLEPAEVLVAPDTPPVELRWRYR